MSRLNLIFVFIFLGLLTWISFFQSENVSRVQKGTLRLFSPFIKVSGDLSDSTATLEIEKMSYSELKEAYELAKREGERLRLEVLEKDELLIENNELRGALQYKSRSPLNLLPTRVINRKPLTWYKTLTIDKGGDDGVRPDLAVIVPAGDDAALVGKVSEVIGPHTSVVLLLTDEMCQVPALIRGTQEQGIVNGERSPTRNQPMLNLRYLSKEVRIREGDLVVSSGIGEVFRKNLLLGEVVDASKGVIDTEAKLVPVIDFEKLRDVFIIMKGDTGILNFQTEASHTSQSNEVGGQL